MLLDSSVIEPNGYFVSARFLAGIYTKNTVIPVGLLAGICTKNTVIPVGLLAGICIKETRSPLTTCGDDKII